MKISSFALVALFCAVPSVAGAATTPYISGSVGIVKMDDSEVTRSGLLLGTVGYDSGYALSVAAGLDSGAFRFEGAVGHQNSVLADYDDLDFSMTTLMLNGYYDFEGVSESVVPFIMGGVGAGVFEDEDSVTVAQVGAGVGVRLSSKMIVDVGYRYLMTPGIKIG